MREAVLFPDIASEIEAMAEADQQMRQAFEKTGTLDAEIDRKNTERMKEIVEKIGWPTKSKVGERPSYQAWLIVQHATHERGFMEKCLALMRAESAGEVDPQNIAYLDDRLRTLSGLPQRYGTQFKKGGDGYVSFEIEDPEHVDERRQTIGLDSLEEELALMNTPPETDKE